MSKTKTTAAGGDVPMIQIEDDAQYKIVLAERAELLGQTLYPGNDYTVSGVALKDLADKVSHAEKV